MNMTARVLADHLAALPRERFLPAATELTATILPGDGLELVIKHDDAQSLAAGGNKLRKLEFIVADARARGADTLVTSGALQSNHARATAGVAARLGMRCHLLLRDIVAQEQPEYRSNGNRVLFSLFNATHEIVRAEADIDAATAAAVERLRAQGRRPYVVPFGGSSLLGCLGYAACAEEIARQFPDKEMPDAIMVPLGTGGTYAGLVAGFHSLRIRVPVIGYCVFDSAGSARARVEEYLREIAAFAALDAEALLSRVEIDDEALGPGYGLPDMRTLEAIRWAGGSLGLVLDPVYTGKAMAGVLKRRQEGRLAGMKRILFLHTGGQPGVFAYASAFTGPHNQTSEAPA